MTTVLLCLAALGGLIIGSFLNVVIWRVPRGESIVSPPSHCPSCDARITPRDEVPVLSWLLLRGRCRSCAARISARYPAVELATAVIWVLLAWRLIARDDLWAVPAFFYLGAIGVALTLIDIDVKRLPDAITLPSYVVGPVLLLLPAVIDHRWHDYLHAAVGLAALYVFYFALWYVYPSGMGFGDVKLAGVLGLYLGWLGYRELVVGAFLGFLLGGVIGVALAFFGRRRPAELAVATEDAGGSAPPVTTTVLKTKIPYGPYMIAGALVSVLAGHPLAELYLSHLGS